MIQLVESIIIYLIVTTFLYSCGEKKDEYTSSEKKTNSDFRIDSTNILFKNKHNIDNYFHLSEKTRIHKDNLASIFDKNSENKIETLSSKKSDNILLVSNENYYIFRHHINFLDFYDYVIKKGDSVSIEYIKGKPVVQVLNRDILKYDLTFEEFAWNRFAIEQYSPLAEYLGAEHLYAQKFFSDKNLIKKSKKLNLVEVTIRNDEGKSAIKHEYGEKAKLYLNKEDILLDSIKKLNQISVPIFKFYKEKIKYLNLLIDLETNKIDSAKVKIILSSHKKNKLGYPELYYSNFLKAVEKKYFADNTKYFLYGGTVSKDYRKIYLNIDSSSFLPEKDKCYLLTLELEKINSLFSHEDFASYYKFFENRVKDTSLLRSVREDYALEFDSSRNETSSVIIQDSNEKKLTLQELKERHKGKIIYVDFWASWCGPCRAELPASARLRNALRDKDLVFIYLSIDNSPKAWRKASVKEKLSDYAENYLIINHETSEFLKQNKLTSIPRYMIFDKTGRLMHANAPRVESIEIGLLLTELAAKP